MRPRSSLSLTDRVAIGVPAVWLALFVVAPAIVVLLVSFGEPVVGVPPFRLPIGLEDDGSMRIAPNTQNFDFLFGDALYRLAYLQALGYAALGTAIALLIGYPMAYAIARAPARRQPLLLFLVVLPFWTSFLIRIYAWIGLLRPGGLVNEGLLALGLVSEPLPLLGNGIAVTLGLVYGYLPFMVLPLYATLEKLDRGLLEAAADLGARPWAAFRSITLPLSIPGVAAGSLLVFIPMVGEFVVPDLLGGPGTITIGRVLWTEFFQNRDWPLASAVAVAMLVLLAGPIAFARRALRGGEAS